MPENLPELQSILQSGKLSYGKWGKKFEQSIGEFVGNNLVVTTNSYNSAMIVALATIGVESGDEIIASPMSCLASNQPFITQGAKVVWADIDPATGTLDPISVRSKITSKTKAIFHNHFCGYVGYVKEINAIGKEFGILVVDDAIEAFGSEYDGRKVGCLGTDMTIFSFQTVRLPNTIDGGAISFRNEELFEKAKQIRDYGINRTHFRDELGEINPNCDIIQKGFGATMPEINSYIGVVQMEKVPSLLAIQRKNALSWENGFVKNNSFDVKTIKRTNRSKPNNWVFGIIVTDKRKMLVKMRDSGYYASSVHINNNIYSVFGEVEVLIGVKDFYDKFLAVPCGWWVNKD